MPACRRCIDHGLQCPGYERKLEFIYFDGQSKANPDGAESEKEGSLVRKQNREPRFLQRNSGSSSHRNVELKPSNDLPLIMINGILDYSLAASQKKEGFITLLQGRYVSDFPSTSSSQSEFICTSWIATARALASSSANSEMLNDSILAMSLSLIGPERQHQDLSMAGLKRYSQALKALRKGLASGALDLDDYQMDVSLVTCLACGMYEVYS